MKAPPQGSGGGVTSAALDTLLGSVDGLFAKRVSGSWTQAAAGGTVPLVAQGRLTLVSGDPSPATDQTGKSTLYYTPFNGNRLALYVSSAWQLDTFSEPSIALSGLTSGKNYDVFAYDNAGTVTLELLAWTDDTTRAAALARQDGVWVKSGSPTRRYLGTIRTTGTTTTEDSNAKRFVWNADNRLLRGSSQVPATDFSQTSNAAWASLNGGSAEWIHALVVGLAEDDLHARARLATDYLAGLAVSLGVDGTTPHASACESYWRPNAAIVGALTNLEGSLSFRPSVGYHTVQALAYGDVTAFNIYCAGISQSAGLSTVFAR